MPATAAPPAPAPRKHARASRKRRPDRNLAAWFALATPLVALGLLLVAGTLLQPGQDETVGQTAPAFSLPDTAGRTVSLADLASDGDVLLYFSMGVGCDGCFVQIPEIADELRARGVTLAPIMVDRPDWLDREAHRLGVHTPILVDEGAEVSAAYGMLGQYGHGDRPSHSFALVREGEVVWTRHYAEMFVPAEAFFGELPT
jgi:peroxiredoxin